MANKKKILIITLYGNSNFGNKLQNYALQEKISSLNFDVETLVTKYSPTSLLKKIKNIIGTPLQKIKRTNFERMQEKNFLLFNRENLKLKKEVSTFYKIDKSSKNSFDYYVYGSDQIWNPYYSGDTPLYLGQLTAKEKNIVYAASFGISALPPIYKEKYKSNLKNFKYISVREEEGKKIVDALEEKNIACVLIDPTLLLTREKWESIMKQPSQWQEKKYIFNCFLGDLSIEKKNVIEKFAKENNCQIINAFDKNSPLYTIGPSEFLYLEKNAFLICTDSFHSCVFAFLFDVPFVVFERESATLKSMYSRIDNLINKFNLNNRKYNGKKITEENLKHDYQEAYKILEIERKKSDEFLRMALDVKGEN